MASMRLFTALALVALAVVYDRADAVRHRPKVADDPENGAPTPQANFDVMSFNIENAVKFYRIAKNKHGERLNLLFEKMRSCSVLFLQEYTSENDDAAWKELQSKLGDHFRLITPTKSRIVKNSVYVSGLEDAYRVAIAYDSKIWEEKQPGNLFILPQVDKLSTAESFMTHIKNRAAMHAVLTHRIDRIDVDFINIHLDAVSVGQHKQHHPLQFQHILTDWLNERKPLRPDELRLVIGGDTNYRAGKDGDLLNNLLGLSNPELTAEPAITQLKLHDTCESSEQLKPNSKPQPEASEDLNACEIPTHYMSRLHEAGVKKVVKKAAIFTRWMGLGPTFLEPKRLDVLAANAQVRVYAPGEVIRAQKLSDHSAIIAHLSV